MAGKKGKKSKGGETEKKGGDVPSEREIAARVELDKLNDELSSVKMEVFNDLYSQPIILQCSLLCTRFQIYSDIIDLQVDRLRKENEWLKDEANRTKMESHEYLQVSHAHWL